MAEIVVDDTDSARRQADLLRRATVQALVSRRLIDDSVILLRNERFSRFEGRSFTS